MKTVIIAAGKGSRLWNRSDQCPKTLLPFGEETILSQILRNCSSIGLSEFVLVVGFGSPLIREYLECHDHFELNITLLENPEWERGNGLSVCAARRVMQEDETFLLSMSDHIVSPAALEKVLMYNGDKNILLVDPRLDQIFDIEDATKVHFQHSHILSLGKTVEDFNGVDCGVFQLNPHFFQAAEKQIHRGKESLTELLQPLIAEGQLIPLIIPGDSHWIDIDTPASYQHALSIREQLISKS
jgi:choline kinase